MYAGTELAPYMAAIRDHVCSRCFDRPPGGPPCLPHGKRCGIEINLKQLVDSVRGVDSQAMEPYVQALHDGVCEDCSIQLTSQCPCPLFSLVPLAVEAIESVNQHDQTL